MKILLSIALGAMCFLPSTEELKASSVDSVTDAGGRIVTWSENPWYLENTSEVRYCIEVDKNFSLSIDAVRPIVSEAFQTWKGFFKETVTEDYKKNLSPYHRISVGTQDFVEENCRQETSIRFQFGFLTEEQQQTFQEPKQFIGAAVRTKYDTTELRSKGYIYIASLTGELAPYSNDIAVDAYNDFDHPEQASLALKINLIHELGHVFGLGHSSIPVMEARLPHAMISKEIRKGLTGPVRENIKSFWWHYFNPMEKNSLNRKNARSSCQDNHNILTPEGKIFFGVSMKCHYVDITFDGYRVSLEVKQSNDNIDWEVLYNATTKTSGSNSTELASIALPENQKVFSNLEQDSDGNKRYFYTAESLYSYRKISIKSGDGLEKPVLIHANTDNLYGQFDMSGSVDNRVETLMYGFNWGSTANDKLKTLRKSLQKGESL